MVENVRNDDWMMRKVTGPICRVAGAISACLVVILALSACSPATVPAGDVPLSVRQTQVAAEGAMVGEQVAVATAWARATDDEIARMQAYNAALARQQELELQAITVTVESVRANLQLQSEAITNTIAISEAQAASLAEQRAYSETLSANVESARLIAEGETARANLSGWLWFLAALAAAGALIVIATLLTSYMVLWFRSGTRKLAATEAAHVAMLANMLPTSDGMVLLGQGFNPYRAIMRLGNDVMPAYEFLGLPAPTPETFDGPVQRRDTIPVNAQAGRVQTELDRDPELSPLAAKVRDFLKNAITMMGEHATRLPTQRAYMERYKCSPNSWQDPVNALTPQHLEGRGTHGTVICSRRYKTLGALLEAVRSGELQPGPARMARVQADQVEIVESGD